MEQHPVPKNVLTVEFKLFGNLTVAQFLRIIGGGVIALVIYVLGINPLISFPLIAIVLFVSISSALVKDFNVRITGIVRALFVSPRYVWRKKESVPDVLREERTVKKDAANAAAGSKTSEKQITDISLDRLLDARAAAVLGNNTDDGGGSNFDRVYGQEFEVAAAPRQQGGKLIPANNNLAGALPTGQEVRLGPNSTMVVQPVKNAQPRPLAAPPTEKQQIEADQMASLYEQEIQGLQDRLTELTKQGAAPEQKQQVIDRINQLYAGIKHAATSNQPPAESKKLDPKRMVYGVVVDKGSKPIGDVQVSVFDNAGNQVGPVAISGEDGRFAVESEFANGEYVVSLSHPKYQFLKFKIRVQADRLPAYRFREK